MKCISYELQWYAELAYLPTTIIESSQPATTDMDDIFEINM